jgi:molecular chaperone HtpG
MKPQKQTLKFQAEINQLLHLVTHSLYNNKEVFLRELISNASDALDKLRFSALSQGELYEDDSNLKIQIKVDKENSTLSVTDNGIGMTRAEVIENLGMIAKSGTKEFLSKLTENKQDASLIGQFGVGFYSAFIVADKVIVKTRTAGASSEEGVYWESTGTGDYIIENINKPQRGTEIVLHIKKEDNEYLEDLRLRNVITKYSDHIPWPIMMEKPVSATTETEAKEDNVIEAVTEEVVNQATALWRLSKNDITEDQYKAFYKHVSHDFSEPLAWSHNHVEGKQHYISLFYIPSRAPYDLWHQDSQHGLKLYINRVFILEGANQFLPRYLRFVRGVLDSSDLPLNVSREFLQTSDLVSSIKKTSVKKILTLLEKMAENEKEKYAKFWEEFGLTLKEGLIEDYDNRDQLAKLLRFSTTRTDTDDQETSLKDYLARKLEGQEEIYYVFGKNLETVRNVPHLEAFKEKGIEVIFLTDRIDEWLLSHLTEFEGKKLKSITSGDVNLDWVQGSESKEEKDPIDESFSSFLSRIKETLKDKVKDVRISHRLTTFPVCFVNDSLGSFYPHFLKNEDDSFRGKPILEVNSKHPLIHKLKEEKDNGRFEELASILYDQAVLSEGKTLHNSAEYVKRVNSLLVDLIN